MDNNTKLLAAIYELLEKETPERVLELFKESLQWEHFVDLAPLYDKLIGRPFNRNYPGYKLSPSGLTIEPE